MMQIVYFDRTQQFLTEMGSHVGETVYVTPSPAKADNLRTKLDRNSDVITIAKFTSQLVEALWTEGAPEVKRKSELLLIFGILKTKHLPTLGYEQFIQAYNLFSDLRSFTLNLEALTPVLDEQSPEVRKGIELFWNIIGLMGFVDEHGAYHELTEALRSSNEKLELKKRYVFWGFQHLNGQQVDLLKALAIRYDVIIPFPLSLKDKLRKTDWVSWLQDVRVEERELSAEITPRKASWLPVNSREMAKTLKEVLKPSDQIILGVSKLSASHLDLIPSGKLRFKIPHQVIDSDIALVSRLLWQKFFDANQSLSTLRRWLHEEFHRIVSEKKPEHLRKLKVLQLYQEAIGFITDLTDEEPLVDGFFLKLLHEVVILNQPRTAFIPIGDGDFSVDLKDMSNLDDIEGGRRVIFCVDERNEEIQSLGQNYTETIQKTLATIGPLKRSELELLFKQWQFQNVFAENDCLVLMAESTLKHSLIWKRLFQNLELQKLQGQFEAPARTILDHLSLVPKKTFEGSFSASKLQTFLDCPRKFYFSYVERMFPSMKLEKDFDALSSGTVLHKIIEEFYHRGLAIERLPELTKEVMEGHIKTQGLELSREARLQREIIFNHRSANGIQFLKKTEDVMGESIKWDIEREFKLDTEIRVSGRIDCIGVTPERIYLLDFKSSVSSASSNKEIEELESLQLWVYAMAAAKLIPDFSSKKIILGYVVLDDPSASNLMVSHEDDLDILKASKEFKVKLFKDQFAELFQRAQEKLLTVAASIKAETRFPATPRKLSACHFCELNKVCVKSEMGHE